MWVSGWERVLLIGGCVDRRVKKGVENASARMAISVSAIYYYIGWARSDLSEIFE